MTGRRLTLESVSLELGGRRVLEEVSFVLEPGRIVGLIGPNGAGKSSLLRALNGFIPIHSGAIRFDDVNLDDFSAAERARKITYVGADLETDFPLTVEEFVELGTFSMGQDKRDRATEIAKILEETGSVPYRDRRLSELSSGERQRVHLARALVQGADWICLDESFSRLDLHHQARIGALLRKFTAKGFSFLFVSHDLNFTTDWADECILLDAGKIIAKGPTAVTVNEENLRRLYPEADIMLAPHPTSGAMKVYFRG